MPPPSVRLCVPSSKLVLVDVWLSAELLVVVLLLDVLLLLWTSAFTAPEHTYHVRRTDVHMGIVHTGCSLNIVFLPKILKEGDWNL